MSNAVSIQKPSNALTLEDVIMYGDLSKLTPDQRVQYVAKLCESTGLNPLTKPFEFITLNGKLVCYAGKNCAEQLRNVRRVSLRITSREKIEDVYVVTAEASMPDGRIDSATGAVTVAGLKGESLANAMMKAETKAKRRATLSICSLGMLDETEVESIPQSSANTPDANVRPQQPEAGDGVQIDRGYMIDFGKWNKKSLEQVYRDLGPTEIAGYIAYLEGEAKKKGATPAGKVAVFISEAEQFLGAMEGVAEPGSDG